MLLVAVGSPLAAADPAFSLAASQLLARVAGSSEGRHTLDSLGAPHTILNHLVDSRPALPIGTQVGNTIVVGCK